MKDRRKSLKAITALPVVGAPLVQASGAFSPQKYTQKKTAFPVSHRRRRILWNNDGDDLWGPAHGRRGFPESLESVDQYLELRMKDLEGTQVDSLFYCGFGTQPNWEFPRDRIKALGPDPLKHVVDFAHRNKMEFMFSIRMNDIHDSFMPDHWKFKLNHPELLQANVTRQEFDQKFLPWILF